MPLWAVPPKLLVVTTQNPIWVCEYVVRKFIPLFHFIRMLYSKWVEARKNLLFIAIRTDTVIYKPVADTCLIFTMARRARPQRFMWRCTKVIWSFIRVSQWPLRCKLLVYRRKVIKTSKYLLLTTVRTWIVIYRTVADTSLILTMARRARSQRRVSRCPQIIRWAVRVRQSPFRCKNRVFGRKIIKAWKQFFPCKVKVLKLSFS